MKVIIANDAKRLYGKLDYFLLEKSYLSSASAASVTTISVLNSSGFVANDYIVMGEFGKEKSELIQIDSVSGNDIVLKTSTTFAYDIKTSIYKLEYNQIKFYEDSTALSTEDIKTDYFVSYSHDVVANKDYSISFYNSTTTEETIKGKTATIYDRLLCSISDILQYESLSNYGITNLDLIDKLDIATREILNIFLKQNQDISDLSDRDLLRQPCALLSLYYLFLSLSKNKEDNASMKAEVYNKLYTAKINDISSVINATENDVKLYSQGFVIR